MASVNQQNLRSWIGFIEAKSVTFNFFVKTKNNGM